MIPCPLTGGRRCQSRRQLQLRLSGVYKKSRGLCDDFSVSTHSWPMPSIYICSVGSICPLVDEISHTPLIIRFSVGYRLSQSSNRTTSKYCGHSPNPKQRMLVADDISNSPRQAKAYGACHLAWTTRPVEKFAHRAHNISSNTKSVK